MKKRFFALLLALCLLHTNVLAGIYEPGAGESLIGGAMVPIADTDLQFGIYSRIVSIGEPPTFTLVIEKADGALSDGNFQIPNYGKASDVPWGYYAEQINHIYLDDAITQIGSYAFSGMLLTEDVNIPANLQHIGERAFSGSTRMKVRGDAKLDLSKVTDLGAYAFASCSSLVKNGVVLSDQLHAIADGVFQSTGLTQIDIPDSVTSIGNSAFSGCNFSSLELPAALTSIGDSAFARPDGTASANTRLESLVIPPNVTYIGAKAFYNYTGLKTVEIQTEDPGLTVESEAFGSNEYNAYNEVRTDYPGLEGQPVLVGTDFLTPNEAIKDKLVSGDNCFIGEISPLVKDPDPDGYIEPTCEEPGRQRYIFTFKGVTMELWQEIEKLGHNYQLKETVPATCEKNRYDLYVCQNDSSHTEERNIIQNTLLGHDYQLSEITNPAIAAGRQTIIAYTCAHAADGLHDGSLPATQTSTIEGITIQATTSQSPSDFTLPATSSGGVLNWVGDPSVKFTYDAGQEIPVSFTPSGTTHVPRDPITSAPDGTPLTITVDVAKTQLDFTNTRLENNLRWIGQQNGTFDVAGLPAGVTKGTVQYSRDGGSGWQTEQPPEALETDVRNWTVRVELSYVPETHAFNPDLQPAGSGVNCRVEAGDAENTVYVIGDYTVAKLNMEDVKISPLPTRTYTGEPQDVISISGVEPGAKVTYTITKDGTPLEPVVIDPTTDANFTFQLTDAGKYQVEVLIEKSPYNPKKETLDIEIKKKPLTPPRRKTGLEPYTPNKPQTGVEPDGNANMYDLTGNVQTNAGNYTAVATLKPDYAKNYCWEGQDAIDPAAEIAWSIAKRSVVVPSAPVGTVLYNGMLQKGINPPGWGGFVYQFGNEDDDPNTPDDILTATYEGELVFTATNAQEQNVGSYEVWLELKHPENYQWNEPHQKDNKFLLGSWTIRRAELNWDIIRSAISVQSAVYTAMPFDEAGNISVDLSKLGSYDHDGNPQTAEDNRPYEDILTDWSFAYYTSSSGGEPIPLEQVKDVRGYYLQVNFTYDTDNYALSSRRLPFDITKAALQMTEPEKEASYSGAEIFVDAPEVSGLLEPDTAEAYQLKYTYDTKPDEDGGEVTYDTQPGFIPVGSYAVTVTLESTNYSADAVTTTLNITPADQQVIFIPEAGTEWTEEQKKITKNLGDAAFQVRAEGSLDKDAQYTYTVAQGQGTVADVNAEGLVTIRGAGEAVITASNAGTGNVNLSTGSYTLVVNQATPSLTLEPQNFPYNGTPVTGFEKAVFAGVDGFEKTGDIQYTFHENQTDAENGSNALPSAPSDVGEYWLRAYYPGDANYTAARAVSTVRIEPADLAVTVTGYGADGGKVYDGKAHPAAEIIVTVPGADTPVSYTIGLTTDPDKAAKGDYSDFSALPNVQHVADSGKYFYKVSAPGYKDWVGDFTVQITPVTLTVSSQPDTQKTYDGTTNADGEVQNAAAVGVPDETITVTSATAQYDSPNAGARKVRVDFALQFPNCTGADGSAVQGCTNYTYNNVPLTEPTVTVEYDGQIDKAPLTVSLPNQEMTYNKSTEVPLLGEVSIVSGVQNNESLSAKLADNAMGTANVPDVSAATVTVLGSQIVLEGATAANYMVNDFSAGLTIHPATVTLSFDGPMQAVYTGNELEQSVYAATIRGLLGDDSHPNAGAITYTFYNNEDTALEHPLPVVPVNVGTYIVRAVLEAGGNYTGAQAQETVTIAPDADSLHITAEGYSGTYDGKPHNAAEIFTVTNGTGEIPYTIGLTTDKAQADAGNYTEFTQMPQVTDAIAGQTYYFRVTTDNYGSKDGSFTVTIAPAPVTIERTFDPNKTYDGLPDGNAVTVNSVTVPNSGEDFTIGTTAAARYEDEIAKENKKVAITYMIQLNGKNGANYCYQEKLLTDGTATEELTGSIYRRPIQVTGITAVARPYNGSDLVELTGTPTPGADDLIEGDLVQLTLADGAQGKMADANAGENKPVDIAPDAVALTGDDSGNYYIAEEIADTVVTIERAQPTLTFPQEGTLTYTFNNEKVPESVYTATPGGVAGGVDPTGAVEYAFYVDGPDGSRIPYINEETGNIPVKTGMYYVEASYEGDGNYQPVTKETTLQIVPAGAESLQVQVTPHNSTYDGIAHAAAAIVVTADGRTLQEGTDYTIRYSAPNGSELDGGTTMPQVQHVADSATWKFQVNAPDYGEIGGSFTATVLPKQLTMQFTTATEKVYDGKATASVTKNSETGVDGVEGTDSIAAEAQAVYTAGPDAGIDKEIAITYTLQFTAGIPGDYYITSPDAPLTADESTEAVTVTETVKGTILQADVTVTIEPQQAVYDGQAPEVDDSKWQPKTGTVYGSDSLGIDLAIAAEDPNPAVQGEHVITGTSSNANYKVTFENGIFTVNHRPITVQIGETNGYYGNTPDLSQVILTDVTPEGRPDAGLAPGEDISVIAGYVLAAEVPNAEDHAITAQDGTYGNYQVDFKDGTYHAAKRPITLTALPHESFYGQARAAGIDAPAAEVDYLAASDLGIAVVENDDLGVKLAAEVNAQTPAGTYDILISANGPDISNYDITLENGSYTVKRAALSASFVTADKGEVPISFRDTFQNTLQFTNSSPDTDGTVLDADKNEILSNHVTYTTSDETIATVGPDGTVSIHATGSVRIGAVFTESTNYQAAPETWYTLHISRAGGGIQVDFSQNDLVYTGQPQPLLQVVSQSPETTVLQYRMKGETEWKNDIPTATEAGTYEVEYLAQASGYVDVTGTEQVSILQADPTAGFKTDRLQIAFTEEPVDGDAQNPLSVAQGYDGLIRYVSNDTGVAYFPDETKHTLQLVKDGTVTITAFLPETKNFRERTVSYLLQVDPAGSTITFTADDYRVTFDGKPHGSRISNVVPEHYEIFYSEDGGHSYRLTESPTYTQAGEYTIYFQIQADGYHAKTGEQVVTIDPAPIAAEMFDWSIGDEYTYIGAPIQPPVTVTYEGMILTPDEDYTISYGENTDAADGVQDGSVTVKAVEGEGKNFVGEATVYFNIQPIDAKFMTAVLSRYYGEYGNSENNFADVSVTFGSEPLVNGVDYTLSCEDDCEIDADNPDRILFTNVGMHTVTVTGIGSFEGEVADLSFTLLPSTGTDGGLSLTIDGDSAPVIATYGDQIDWNVVVTQTGSNIPLEEDSYTLEYVYYDNFGNRTSMTPDELHAIEPAEAGMYVATATGQNGYQGTGTFVFLVQQRDLSSLSVTVDTAVYDGTALQPGFTAEFAGYEGLLTEAEYAWEYQNNVNAGEGLLVLTANTDSNNFTGSKRQAFAIEPKPITDAFTVAPIAEQIYTGSPVLPPVKLFDENGTALLDVDYYVIYRNNTDIGTGYATVIGRGNYTGTREDIPFDIVASDHSFTLEIGKTAWIYDGNANAGSIAVKYDGQVLVMAQDYTLTISKDGGEAVAYATEAEAIAAMKDPGEYTVTASGLQGFAGVAPSIVTVTIDKIQPVLTVEVSPSSLSGGGTATVTVTAENLPADTVLTELMVTKDGVAEDPLPLKAAETGYTATFRAPNSNATYVFSVSFAETAYHYAASGEDTLVTARRSGGTTISGGGGGGGGGSSLRYTVTFDTQGGSEIASQKVARNETAVQPVDPEKEGFAFAGWYTDETYEQAYEFSDKVIKNITLYAKWDEVVVETVAHMPYLVGYEDGSFRPQGNITRAEAAVIFARLLAGENGIPSAGYSVFDDVKADAWYGDSVQYLQEFGIIVGRDGTHFAPDEAITRAEFVTICTRFDAYTAVDTINDFADVSASHWAYAYINYAVHEKWITGYEDNTFRPDDMITRAEAVCVVNRVLDRSADEAYIAEHGDTLASFSDLTDAHWAYQDIMEAAVAHDCVIGEAGEEWK